MTGLPQRKIQRTSFKELDSSDDDCYNESVDTKDYDNMACEAIQLQSEHQELPDYPFQLKYEPFREGILS